LDTNTDSIGFQRSVWYAQCKYAKKDYVTGSLMYANYYLADKEGDKFKPQLYLLPDFFSDSVNWEKNSL
jgi:hypothetical protein